MERLHVRIVSEYAMPPICCSCGEPAGPAKFKVYASSWSSRKPFALFFPLCPACTEAYSTVDRRRRAGCWAGLGVAALVAIAGIVGGVLSPGAGPLGSLAFFLFFGAILIGLGTFLLTPLLLSRQVRAPFERVRQAVLVKDYSPAGAWGEGTMTLVFASPPFAAAFRELNDQLTAR